jgi:hypothetical protein
MHRMLIGLQPQKGLGSADVRQTMDQTDKDTGMTSVGCPMHVVGMAKGQCCKSGKGTHFHDRPGKQPFLHHSVQVHSHG